MSLTGKPSLTTATPIANDGFWLDMSMADLMSKYRIPSEYDNNVISWGLTLAIVRVNEQLERVKQAIFAVPYATFQQFLDDNNDPVAGSELLQIHYESAVYSRAKADLLQQFSTINRRDEAENEAKEAEDTEQYWLDQSAKSIVALLKAFFPDEEFSTDANTYVALI